MTSNQLVQTINCVGFGLASYYGVKECIRRGFFGKKKIILPKYEDTKYTDVRIEPSAKFDTSHLCKYTTKWSDGKYELTYKFYYRPIRLEYDEKDITEDCTRKPMDYP
jgi:hypothetical protein